MNLFNKKSRVVKPVLIKKGDLSREINQKIRRGRIDLAERIARENPQYAGLLKEAKKRGKLKEVEDAILSGKLKLRRVKPETYVYHGALPKEAQQIREKGLEARGIKEYEKKKGYNPKENAAIYVFGKVPDEYIYKGKVFSEEFEKGIPQVKTTKTPAKQAMKYPEEKLDRINRERRRKGLPEKQMSDYKPSLIMANIKELAKEGIGLAFDPEITGRTKSYILVDKKTGKPVGKLDPRLMKIISPDKEQIMRRAKQEAEKELKYGKRRYDNSPQRNFMTEKEYEEYMHPALEREFYKKFTEKEMRKGLDEQAIKDIISFESEKAVEEAVKKEVPKKKRKGLLEQLFG